MELAHARDEGLARFGIALDDESRVFLGEALEGDGKLFLVGLALGLDAHRDNRVGEGRGLEADFVFAVAESVARDDVLGAYDGAYGTAVSLFNVVALVGLDDE